MGCGACANEHAFKAAFMGFRVRFDEIQIQFNSVISFELKKEMDMVSLYRNLLHSCLCVFVCVNLKQIRWLFVLQVKYVFRRNGLITSEIAFAIEIATTNAWSTYRSRDIQSEDFFPDCIHKIKIVYV